MKNFLIIASLLIPTSQLSAATIKAGKFNAEKKAIELDVVYGGGCSEHKFTLDIGACQETFPVGCHSVKLVDLTKNDFCEAIISRKILLPLADVGLNQPYFDRAALTIHGDDNSKVAITLPEQSAQPTKRIVCSQQDTKAVPYYTFTINVYNDQSVSIEYVKSAFLGSEEFQVVRPISGCAKGEISLAEIKRDSLYVECSGDGDAGYLSVKRNSKGVLTGNMTFPNSGPDGRLDDVSLPVACR